MTYLGIRVEIWVPQRRVRGLYVGVGWDVSPIFQGDWLESISPETI